MKIESMSSKQAREHGQKTEARLTKVQSRIEAIQPPPKPMGAVGPQSIGAPRWDPLKGAGPEYAAIVEAAKDPPALAALVREHEELVAERVMLQARRDLLRDRVKDAAGEEAVKAAPKAEKEHAAALPEAASKVLAARREFDEARAELEEHLRGLKAARKLTENTDAALGLDAWLEVEAAARLRIDDARPTALRAYNAAGMYVGESGPTVTHPALGLDLLGEPDAPSLWPRWLRLRESMSPRERANSMVPDREEDVRRVARELARRALVQNPPDRDAFHSAWGDAEEIVEAGKEKDAANAKRRAAVARSKAKDDGWINQRSRDQLVK